MYSNIPSVSKVIKDILFSNSIYLNSLKLGIANYTALAIKIKPEVERTIGSEININTIVVSIKRIADALQQNLAYLNFIFHFGKAIFCKLTFVRMIFFA